jgi:hypothetical protein
VNGLAKRSVHSFKRLCKWSTKTRSTVISPACSFV